MSKDEGSSNSGKEAPETSNSGDSGAEAKEGSILPAVVAGAGLLLVAGVLMFGGGDDKPKSGSDKDGATASRDNEGDSSKSKKAGVGGRDVDDAKGSGGKPKPRVNPRIQEAAVFGSLAEQPPGEKGPPEFDTKEEEIEWWEQRLLAEESQLAMRKKAVDRLPKTREQLQKRYPDNFELEFERKKAIVESNLEAQQKKVAEVESKLEELRG